MNKVFLLCLFSAFIFHPSAFSQTSGQSVIDKKNATSGFTREAFTLGNSQVIGRTAAGTLSGITLGTGLSLTGTTLNSAGGAWADITGKPTTVSGFGITDGITADAAAAAYSPLNHTQAISTVTGLQTALDTKANIVAGTAGVAEQVQINFSGANGTQLVSGYYILLYDASGSVGVWWNTGMDSVPNPGFNPSRWIAVPLNLESSEDVDLAAATASALDSDAAFVASAGGTSVNYTLAATGDVSDAEQGNTGLSVTVVTQGQADAQDALAAYDGSNLTGLALANHSHDFSELLNKPTTLLGYGITDPVLLTNSNLNAANLTGTINTACLGTGTASASTYLRGDGTWATVSGGVSSITGTANQITVTGTTTPTLSLPATITGLTSVTSTSFVGALTGTASGNLALTGGTLTGAATVTLPALATTTTPAWSLINSTAALVGAQVQVSPALILEGQGWKTNATAGSQSVRFRQSVLPVTGAAAPAGLLLFQSDINGANIWTNRMAVGYGSTVNGIYTETGGGIYFAGIGAGNQNNLGVSGSGLAQLNLHCNGGITHSIINNASQGLLQAFNAGGFAWSSTGTASGAADVILKRADVGILIQQNATFSQAQRITNTWTSATNWEAGVIDWQTTTNVLRIGSDKGSGGGSNREVQFIMGGTTKITLDTSGNVIVSGLPTSAPATSGALWRDSANGNVLKVVP